MTTEAETKALAEKVWQYSWGALYANGHYTDREKIKVALEAFDQIGYEAFARHSRYGEGKTAEAVTNLVCQAERHGLKPKAPLPELVQRMIRAYRLVNRQWTTGGTIGNIFFAAVFTIFSADYRWFSGLNRE